MMRASAQYQSIGAPPSSDLAGRVASALRNRRLHAPILATCLVAFLLHATQGSALALKDYSGKLKDGYSALSSWRGGSTSSNTSVAAVEEGPPRWPGCTPRRRLSREAHRHRVAYLVMVHTPETLEGARQLVENVWDEDDLFVIHADQKMDDALVATYRESMGICGNVQFVTDERVDVKWGKFSEVFAEITSIKHALRSDIPWDKTILLDGTSWPRLSSSERQAWLSAWDALVAAGGKGPAPEPVCKWECSLPVTKRGWFVSCTDCRRGPARCVDEECAALDLTPGGAHVRKDHQWFLLSRDMAEYAVEGPNAAAWQKYFDRVHAPSEHFFVTLQYAQYPSLGALPPPVYVDWVRPCKTYPSTNGAHPCMLGDGDIEAIRNGDGLFARKIQVNETNLKAVLTGGEEAAVSLPLPETFTLDLSEN
ncbi:Beta-1,3-galactosyl-O-glycosyl-glycoprotein beta-1,6-N-acetylglucosaminyltransferase 3 [Rhodotorula kratochvilovae]